jgi:hypothetical protein
MSLFTGNETSPVTVAYPKAHPKGVGPLPFGLPRPNLRVPSPRSAASAFALPT